MRKIVVLFLLIGSFSLLAFVAQTQADVIIKVRALNPLQTEESIVINYPLPPEIDESDILKKKITYSQDHSQDSALHRFPPSPL